MPGRKRSQESRHQEYLQRCKGFHDVLYGLEHGGSDTRLGRIALGIIGALNPFDPRKLSEDDLSNPAVQDHLTMYLRNHSMNDPGVPAPSQRPFD